MTYTREYLAESPARSEVDRWPGAVLLEFGAPWCGFCSGVQPALADALQAWPGIRHLKIEDGRGRPLGRSFAVKLWPTLVLLRDGVEAGRVVRPGPGEIAALLSMASAAAPPDGTPEARDRAGHGSAGHGPAGS